MKTSLRALWAFTGSARGSLSASVLLSILSVISGMVPYFAIARLLGAFFEQRAAPMTVLTWCLVALCGHVIRVVCFSLSTYLSHKSAYLILEELRLSLAQRLLRAPLGKVTSHPVGKLKDIIVDRVETIELPLAHLIPEGIGYLFVPLAVFIYLAVIDWRMAIAAVITVPLGFILSTPAMRRIRPQYEAYMAANAHMNSVIVEYIEGIKVIKTFNQAEACYGRYTDAIKSFHSFTMAWFQDMWKTLSLTMSVMPSTLLVVVPVGLALSSSGSLSPTDMTVCIILALGLVTPLMGLSGYMNALKMIGFALEETRSILDLEELPDSGHYHQLNSYEVCFENVDFSYDVQGKKVLKKLNLTCKAGTTTALVGPSGSGKSTVARLVARFYDVDAGRITIGGEDIKDIPLAQLGDTVSLVDQTTFLFNCSLMDNIRVGRATASDEEVRAAARAAECGAFIDALPDGYQTSAGEAGSRLSGGEKQRIAIARMILKDAPVVLLDEATAATDLENEAKIQESLNRLTAGKTLLVIAHRLSTIKNADQIVVLKDGEIVDLGTQDELLGRCELYQNMWQAHIRSAHWAAGGSTPEGATSGV